MGSFVAETAFGSGEYDYIQVEQPPPSDSHFYPTASAGFVYGFPKRQSTKRK